MKRPPPAAALLALAPFLGEVMSTSTPITGFVLPWTLLFLAALYGGGALLVREAARARARREHRRPLRSRLERTGVPGLGWPLVAMNVLIGLGGRVDCLATATLAAAGLVRVAWREPAALPLGDGVR